MTTLPDVAAVLVAAHLEALEQAPEMPESPLTLQDAADAERRIKYHQGEQEKARIEAAAIIAPLQAQIDQVKAWLTERIEERQLSIARHERRLIAYYTLNPPAKTQTLKLPLGGTVQMKRPAPKWEWDKDTEALVATVQTARPDLVQSKVVLSVDKTDLKREAVVHEGQAFLATGDGELVKLPVAVVTPPEEYVVKV